MYVYIYVYICIVRYNINKLIQKKTTRSNNTDLEHNLSTGHCLHMYMLS